MESIDGFFKDDSTMDTSSLKRKSLGNKRRKSDFQKNILPTHWSKTIDEIPEPLPTVLENIAEDDNEISLLGSWNSLDTVKLTQGSPSSFKGENENASFNTSLNNNSVIEDTSYIPDSVESSDENASMDSEDAANNETIGSADEDDVNNSSLIIDEPHADRIRRSTRVKVPPLEYWRNEKIIYKRKSSKPVLNIEKIITFDDDDDDADNRTDKKSTTNKSRPKATKQNISNNAISKKIKYDEIPGGEWLNQGMLQMKVRTEKDTNEKEKIIAYAPHVAQVEKTINKGDEKFTLGILFDEHKKRFASGHIKLPVNGYKKPQNSYNTFITLFVMEGMVEVTLNGDTFLSVPGSSFQIPNFNKYSLKNQGKKDAKLFFVQVTGDW